MPGSLFDTVLVVKIHIIYAKLCSKFNRPNESEKSRHLDKLISEADIVVSLLPPPFHAGIAKRCIAEQTHMVTASYVSDDMRELNDSARKAGVILLNEMGLDPGIDHMSAKKIIDEVRYMINN